MRRSFIAALAASCIGLVCAPAWAQSAFPSRPITVIVGVAPGGTLDTLSRLLAGQMATTLKQPVVVENVTGAGGLVGFQRLLAAEPNGHTLMFSNMSMVLIPMLHPKSNIDVVTDVAPIGQVGTVPMVLSVSNKSGIQDLPSMLARMRSGQLVPDMGSGGPGTTAHLAEGLFLNLTSAKGQLIQYRGTGPALTDLMAGTIDAIIDQTVTLLPLHRSQRAKAIAVSSPKRLPQLADVPTFAEGGLPEFDLMIWNGFVAPKGTPKAIIDQLADALSKAIDSAEYRGRLEQLAAQAPSPEERGPAVFGRMLARDQKKLAALVESAGLLPK